MVLRASLILLICIGSEGIAPAGDEPSEQFSLHGDVRGPDGKPIAGAIVSITGTEGGASEKWPAQTGGDGRYSLRVRAEPGIGVRVTQVSVQAAGFVRFDEEFARSLSLRSDKAVELNFVLAPGEVLAGRIEVPMTRGERRAGIKPEERRFGFSARGPSFKRDFATERGGVFEVWVPKGTYSLELIGEPGWPPVRLEQVPSGTRGLKLALVDLSVSEQTLAHAFDAFWEDLDRHYSYFALKQVNWKGLRDRFRPEAVKAGTVRQFVDVLDEMLAGLRDGHVWIEWSGESIAPHATPPLPENYNRQATLATLDGLTPCGAFAVIGKTKGDRFGAFVLVQQSKADKASVDKAVSLIRAMKDVPGFVVDLRNANGGNELLAHEIAREFCGKEVVYAKSKYRNGPRHTDFGPTHDRMLKTSEEPFLKPVVCLIGPRCVSSGEAFAKMMKCLPQVTTIGMRTRGSSGNPKPFKLPGVDVTVYYSRWVDMTPDGAPVEGNGIAPDVELKLLADAHAEKDPTWEKALDLLRKKVVESGHDIDR